MPEPTSAPHPSTLAVTLGRGPGNPGDSLNVPVVPASAFHAGGEVEYARDGNPTWAAFEAAVGALEGGTATAFASGMGAVNAVLDTVPTGAVVVAPVDAYSGTRGRLTDLEQRGRVTVRRVDVAETASVLEAADGAALVWLESPTNPMLAVADLPAAIAGGREAGAVVVVDNTFATPLLQRPLGLGADLVVHSATKLLAGHSDVLLGVAVAADERLAHEMVARRRLLGATPGPLDAWLGLRGLRTLPVRLERAQANAGILAERLAAHPAVARVRYPGLATDPGHALAAAQMHGFGTIVSFELAGGQAAAETLCGRVRLAVHATSLGGVETTLERRARVPGEEAVPPALVRVSVGCEHVEDLWADLAQALAVAVPHARTA